MQTTFDRKPAATTSIIAVAAGMVIAGAALMLSPALGAGNDADDQAKLVAAHQKACKELNGPEAKLQDLDDCVTLLLSFQIGPVEVFVSRKPNDRDHSLAPTQKTQLEASP